MIGVESEKIVAYFVERFRFADECFGVKSFRKIEGIAEG